MKHLLSMAVLLTGVSAWASPAVSIDRVQQRYPWNGMVDIDYTVADVVNPDACEIDLDVTDATGKLWDTVTLLAKPDTTPGTHRLTWNSAADNAQFLARRATFKLNLRQIAVATDGDYMVVDLSRGTNAPAYNVTFLSNVADPTNFFNTTEYKTTKIVLKKIKAGSFWMGSAGTETYYAPYETRHYVTLTNDYFIGLFMLTGGQYKNVVGDTSKGYTTDEQYLTGGIGGYIALNAADGFLARLNARAFNSTKPVDAFRAPTEAQWEYACRAGTTTTWFFGEDESLLAEYAYYADATAPRVGAKKPNPWCLWDLYGTAQEYVYDDYNGKTDYPATTEENPDIEPLRLIKNSRFSNMAMRGGASWHKAASCRSAWRTTSTGGTVSPSNGFRLCIPCHGTGTVTE